MRLRLFSFRETEVQLHAATLLMAGYMVFCGKAALFFAGMISIILHEIAHALAAAIMGQPPETVEITPLGAVMRMEDETHLPPFKRLIMLAAGPALTVMLCVLSLRCALAGMLPLEWCRLLFISNAGILGLNLMPCLPLDGGRMAALLLEQFVGSICSARIMRWLSMSLGMACLAGSLILTWQTGTVQFALAACGCVILYAAQSASTTAAMAELRSWMERKIRMEQRGVLPVKPIAVMDSTTLRQAIRRLPQRAWGELILLEAGSMRVLGRYSESDLISAYMCEPGALCRTMIGKV